MPSDHDPANGPDATSDQTPHDDGGKTPDGKKTKTGTPKPTANASDAHEPEPEPDTQREEGHRPAGQATTGNETKQGDGEAARA